MRQLLRGEDGRVGFVELFYDLVFVFAITQISHFLLHHYTIHGAIEATILFFAIWWVWIYTTWVLNRLDPDRLWVRIMLFLMMLGGLFVSMAIPRAFEDRGLVFAIAFVAMQWGRTLFMCWAGRGDPLIRRTFLRIFAWFVASGIFWIAGGLAEPETRMFLWVIALAIEYAGPAMGFYVPRFGRDVSTDWAVNGGHIAERAGLFVIICLGETLLVSGATFADLDWQGDTVFAFLASVATSIAMWWVYFNIGHKRGTHQIEHAEDPGRLARLAFTYAHIPILAGIVLGAVASERAIAHPHQEGNLAEVATAMGGLILFLAGNGWFKKISAKWFPLSHLVGIGLSVAVGVIGAMGMLNLLWLNIAAAVILAIVAVWEDMSLNRHPAAI